MLSAPYSETCKQRPHSTPFWPKCDLNHNSEKLAVGTELMEMFWRILSHGIDPSISFLSLKNINSKCIKDFSVRSETLKPLEEIQGKNVKTQVWERTCWIWLLKTSVERWDDIKSRGISTAKGTERSVCSSFIWQGTHSHNTQGTF